MNQIPRQLLDLFAIKLAARVLDHWHLPLEGKVFTADDKGNIVHVTGEALRHRLNMDKGRKPATYGEFRKLFFRFYGNAGHGSRSEYRYYKEIDDKLWSKDEQAIEAWLSKSLFISTLPSENNLRLGGA